MHNERSEPSCHLKKHIKNSYKKYRDLSQFVPRGRYLRNVKMKSARKMVFAKMNQSNGDEPEKNIT